MKEALIYHLPLKRNSQTPPEVTFVVRRFADDRWHAGISVCSRSDQFVKRIGRARAASDLRRRPFMANNPGQLIQEVSKHLTTLNSNRPQTLSKATLSDLEVLIPSLEKMVIT